MLFKIQYETALERDGIVAQNSDKYLLEEQNITEGNFLIFSDIPTTDTQLMQIKEDNLILMDVLATMYEDMLMKGMV